MSTVDLSRRTLLGGALTMPVARAMTPGPTLPRPDPRAWDPALPFQEGFASGPNGRIYWRRYPGPPDAIPVVVLHGGPAAGHRYLRPYAALASKRSVLFYDQSGCGRSAAPEDLRRYTAARYVDELEALRNALGIERMTLIGHSWGAFLAPLYAARHPERVSAMVLAGGAATWRDFQLASDRWLAALGPSAIDIARRAETTGRTDTPDYARLMARYYSRHLCRLDPMPPWLIAEGEKLGANPVYRYLNGPSEFEMTGRFAALDLRPVLPRLTMPTLVTCGEFDEGPPWAARITANLLQRARLHVFPGLAHMTHVEQPSEVIGVTSRFLRRVDAPGA